MFYSEGASYWLYFEPVVQNLIREFEQSVCYVTSDARDPLLDAPLTGMRSFYVGAGAARTVFFAGLDAGVMVMTLPDLGHFEIKRSPHPVHYVYLHHSIVSTHMIYRRGAFDHFDSILCVGPHHVAETEAWEKREGLRAKELFHHGYGPMDALLEGSRHREASSKTEQPRVLVAPSWGPNGLLEKHGVPVVETLLGAGCHVVVRPHPRTAMLTPDVIRSIRVRFGEHERFEWDEDAGSKASFFEADVMVSDWSGAALEFAFGLERPVLYLDVERKVNNPDYGTIEPVPLEVAVRESLGAVVHPNKLRELPEKISALLAQRAETTERIREARSRWVFNPGTSGRAGAEIIAGLVGRSR